uniref:Uncharacterized protein n=1 Tax=Sphaerodactylus townsendi TaxID=933632 RepID=A0ACB8FS53_9SAUR
MWSAPLPARGRKDGSVFRHPGDAFSWGDLPGHILLEKRVCESPKGTLLDSSPAGMEWGGEELTAYHEENAKGLI